MITAPNATWTGESAPRVLAALPRQTPTCLLLCARIESRASGPAWGRRTRGVPVLDSGRPSHPVRQRAHQPCRPRTAAHRRGA